MGRINRLIPTTTLTANSVIAMDAESGGNTNKVTIQTLASGLRSFGNYATQTDLNRKQDVLTFDDSPEEDSDNPVTSGGIYNAIGSAMSNVYTKAETDNAIAQSTATLKTTSLHSNFYLMRVGNTVLCNCDGGNYNMPSANAYLKDENSANLDRIPTGFCPAASNASIQIMETNYKYRLVLGNYGTQGWRFTSPNTFTNAALRFSAVWVTTDAMPT